MNRDMVTNILLGKWDKIVIQGGDLLTLKYKDFFELSGIWFLTGGKWVDIMPDEKIIDHGYLLNMSIMSLPPIPDNNVYFSPRRKEIIEFPEDCQLNRLIEFGVSRVEFDDFEECDDCWYLGKRLLLESGDGSQFEFIASEELLGSIELLQLR